ncbi:WXG100 family type VII secretion target [Nocardia sp. NPDC051321]|uniref:WXG100 family type VII secretion target n=1 Tax=Nocardia sp. NPDC051321 TaxID=3364323 RepID=UPI00379B2F57
MNKPIKIEPDGLRRSADNFDELADKAKKLLETLKSSTSSKGEAWGGDKSGKKFAEGEKGYKKGRDNTFESLGAIAGVFEENAKNFRDSAKIYEENEQRLVENMRTRDKR